MDKKVVYHFYIPALTDDVENWLKEMALNGWKLIDLNYCKFTFQRITKQEIEYFMYSSFGTHKGISFDYYMAERLYRKSKSILDKNGRSGIFEVDVKKIDSKFYSYRRFRNKAYKKHYFKFSLISLIALAIVAFFSIDIPYFFLLGIPYLLFLVYSLVSIFILTKAEEKNR